LLQVFWCPASDGVSLEHSPGAATGSGSGDRGEQRGWVEGRQVYCCMLLFRPEEEDQVLWDYCTPAPEQLEEVPACRVHPACQARLSLSFLDKMNGLVENIR
jgi:hypothetical protein